MNKYTLDFVKAALIRAFRTFCQTAVSMITVGAAIDEVNWRNVVSISVVAAVVSILTSFATGLPEASSDGELLVNADDPDEMLYTLSCNGDPALWANKKSVLLNVVKDKKDTPKASE